jgi:hypothetical protein
MRLTISLESKGTKQKHRDGRRRKRGVYRRMTLRND